MNIDAELASALERLLNWAGPSGRRWAEGDGASARRLRDVRIAREALDKHRAITTNPDSGYTRELYG